MFDNLKETISAAESVFSDIKWHKEDAEQAVDYWTDKFNQFKYDNPNDEGTYYMSKLNEANIRVQIFEAIEKTICSFVRQALK